MKLTPVAGPGQVQDLSTPEHVRTAKMMSAFNTNSAEAQKTAGVDPNNISAEEIGAVKPPVKAQAQEQEPETEVNNATLESEPETQADPEVQKRFAQIARQERQLRAKIHQENQKLKAREQALQAREAALTTPAQPDLSQYIPRERFKADPLAVLEEEQVSWDELTQQAVNRQPTDPRVMSTIQKLEAKIAQLEESNKTSAKSQVEAQQAQYQAAVKQIKADAKQLVYTDPEFETVKAMNAVSDIVELIEATYKQDGIVLSVEEAAREVENYLVEEAMKVTQLEKIKKRMAAANASRPTSETKTQETKQPQMKTLTNATSSTRKLSARDRAIARANGHTGEF